MDNSRYNIDNQPRAVKQDVLRQDFAQLAQSARPQFEINRNATGKEPEGSPTFANYVYEHAPELLQAACKVFKTERQRDVFLTSAVTILSGCFNSPTGLYDGKMVNANLYCMVVAPPASDKGVMNWARELGMGVHKRLITENEVAAKRYKVEMAEYKSASKVLDSYAVSRPLPVEPVHKMLYIPANSSSAAIMRHIQQNDGGGIICETEIDTLTNTFKQEWGNFDDLLRKAFHQETFSYSRKTNNEFVEVLRPKPAVALSGTPGQASRLLVSNENGLVSRFIFYFYKTPAVWRDPSPIQNIDLGVYFQGLSERVHGIYNDLKDKAIVFALTANQWSIHKELYTSKLAVADEDQYSTLFRMGLIVYKMAMVLTILRNEGNFPVDGKVICSDTDFRIALLLADVYLKHAELVYQSLLVPVSRNMDSSKMKFLEALPSATPFPRKDAVAIGAVLSIAERTVGKYIEQFCTAGLLEQVKYGTYCKK